MPKQLPSIRSMTFTLFEVRLCVWATRKEYYGWQWIRFLLHQSNKI